MRIIAGTLKGRRLATPEADSLLIRPTADRAREALFSILGAYPKGAFLDLYAGTGAVALEAFSRGYEPVICVEKSPEAHKLLRRNMEKTTIQVVESDVSRLKADRFKDVEIIFADPPYEHSLKQFENLSERIHAWIRPGGLLVWESDRATVLPESKFWRLVDQRRYGACSFHFLLAE